MVLASNEMPSVAELRGGARDATPPIQILSILGNFGSWRPLLGEILDPPLVIDECCCVPFAFGDNNTDFWCCQHIFYVFRNGLHGYQCNCLHMMTEKHVVVVKCKQTLIFIKLKQHIPNYIDMVKEWVFEHVLKGVKSFSYYFQCK